MSEVRHFVWFWEEWFLNLECNGPRIGQNVPQLMVWYCNVYTPKKNLPEQTLDIAPKFLTAFNCTIHVCVSIFSTGHAKTQTADHADHTDYTDW